ncbi:MAG TPA: c-type cytochrome, partial [Gemmatimonadaceae bacterium]
VPAGTSVHLLLQSSDVIHSFWVPALAGKTQLIPGQTTRMWIEADTAGRYLGECAVFCGTSHANMRVAVIADPPPQFAAWEAQQRMPAALASAEDRTLLSDHGCAACHTIRGTEARGVVGPDLTHVASRTTLASGIIANTHDNLVRWLSAPDSVKPGTLMPNVELTPQELIEMVKYLSSLR